MGIYEWMLSHPGGPAKCRVLSLKAAEQPPPPPGVRAKITCYINNFYLQFENIRSAALARKFELFQVGYYRHADMVAATARLARQGRGKRRKAGKVASISAKYAPASGTAKVRI
jgi:hypothetical protein